VNMEYYDIDWGQADEGVLLPTISGEE
jgi:hypothetical protein